MKAFLIVFFFFQSLIAIAEGRTFCAEAYNSEYDLTMKINLYADSVSIPGQEILGNCYGYLKKNTDQRAWIIVSATVKKGGKSAELEIINDYGSEDLTAELSLTADSTYTLRQVSGSTIKVANRGKWQKLPKEIKFVRK